MAFCRGLTGTSKNNLGNFYVDLVRITTRILIPFSIIVTLILVWQGAPQNFMANQTVTTIEGTQQDIAMGPIASLVSIKHLAPTAAASWRQLHHPAGEPHHHLRHYRAAEHDDPARRLRDHVRPDVPQPQEAD